MDIGTVEPSISQTEIRRARGGSATGPGGGPGRRNGDDGGPDETAGLEISETGKAKVLTWFLLLVVLMTFGGLCAAYIVTATNKAIEWRPFSLPVQVWISTAIILVSSYVYHRGKVALDEQDQVLARRWLMATTVLGAAFISSQLLAWVELNLRGLYFSGNPYAGFFYILTAVHAAHVLGGIVALGSIVLIAWNPIASEQRWTRVRSLGQVVGWYWHFMGAVWLVLFFLLGFWQ